MLGTLGGSTGRVVMLALLMGAALAAESASAASPQDGVLVLRNGQTLEGKISRVGDLYYVAVPEGVIRLKTGDVELCCRDIEEAYQRKRAAILMDNVEEHLTLAQWCQKQHLFEHATAELAAARRADPNHPLIDVLQRRLQLATEPAPKHPVAPAERPVSSEELARAVRGLPTGTVEVFAQTIQPLLINNCTRAGCHGGQTQKLPLARAPANGPPSRRLTQRNLYEVLHWVDHKQPDASPLLTVPLQPHGTARTAIFSESQAAQYKRMVDWVHAVTCVEPAEVPASVDRAGKSPVQATSSGAPIGFGFEAAPPGGTVAKEASLPRKSRLKRVSHQADPRPKTVTGDGSPSAGPAAPADPQDPEIFNRRFFPAPATMPDGK